MVDLAIEEDGVGHKCDDGNDDDDFVDLEDEWWLIVVDKFVIQVFFNDVLNYGQISCFGSKTLDFDMY